MEKGCFFIPPELVSVETTKNGQGGRVGGAESSTAGSPGERGNASGVKSLAGKNVA